MSVPEDGLGYTVKEIAKMIDHSLLRPEMTDEVMERGIQIALEYDVASVCILPHKLKDCAQRLAGSDVQPSTTIGFPHGAHTTDVKVAEARRAIADGGTELDMVVNISRVLSGDWDYVRNDIKAVTDVAHDGGGKVKVIFENCYLKDPQKIRLSEICGEIGVDWVKTSTGFGTGGAVDEDLRLMRKHSPDSVQVKAAGGVRDLDRALEVRALGVTRFGCTATVVVLDECRRRLAASGSGGGGR